MKIGGKIVKVVRINQNQQKKQVSSKLILKYPDRQSQISTHNMN